MFAVPYKAIISVSKAKAVPELAKVFRMHPELFDKEEHNDWEHYILIAFLLFEMQKGKSSYWYPYIQILPRDAHCFWRWNKEIIQETQDPSLILQRFRQGQTYRESVESVMACFKMHPEVFDPKFVNAETLMMVEAWVDTRVFGSNNLPTCALVPFADALNHGDNWIQMNSVNKEIHHLGQQAPGGYCR